MTRHYCTLGFFFTHLVVKTLNFDIKTAQLSLLFSLPKAHQKLQLNNNGLHDLNISGLRNGGSQGCNSPASSRRFQNNNTGTEQGLDSSENEREQFPTNFRAIVHRSAPQIPSVLLRRLELSSANSGRIGSFQHTWKNIHLGAFILGIFAVYVLFWGHF